MRGDLPWGQGALLALDADEQLVGLFESDWLVRYWQEHYPRVHYREISGERTVDVDAAETSPR